HKSGGYLWGSDGEWCRSVLVSGGGVKRLENGVSVSAGKMGKQCTVHIYLKRTGMVGLELEAAINGFSFIASNCRFLLKRCCPSGCKESIVNESLSVYLKLQGAINAEKERGELQTNLN
nr:valine--tRNA ligase, mitochondrial 1 [Tanacetum cinerariifolium]